MESMKSSPSRVCERGDGEPSGEGTKWSRSGRAVSAQRSRQQAGSNAGSGLCSGGYGGRQGSGAQREGAAEGSAERATPSSATPMVLRIVGENTI